MPKSWKPPSARLFKKNNTVENGGNGIPDRCISVTYGSNTHEATWRHSFYPSQKLHPQTWRFGGYSCSNEKIWTKKNKNDHKVWSDFTDFQGFSRLDPRKSVRNTSKRKKVTRPRVVQSHVWSVSLRIIPQEPNSIFLVWRQNTSRYKNLAVRRLYLSSPPYSTTAQTFTLILGVRI